MIPLNDAEHATLRAALQHYRDTGQGEPSCRADSVHELATDSDRVASSLDEAGIDALIGKFAAGGPRAPLPADAQGWSAAALERGWAPAVLSHAQLAALQGTTYDNESSIQMAGTIQIRCPAYPEACDYVRLVDTGLGDGVELMYWTADEWQAEPHEVMGAILGLARQSTPHAEVQPPIEVARRLAMRAGLERAATICAGLAGSRWVSIEAANEMREAIDREVGGLKPIYQRTATPGQMAQVICEILKVDASDEQACEAHVRAVFPAADWMYEVANGNTTAGYWEWALTTADMNATDDEAPARMAPRD